MQLCCSIIHSQICLFEHLAQRNRQKSMKRTQTIKITDHKQKFHFPAKFLVCVVNMKLKVCRQGGETVQWLKHVRGKHKDISSPPDPVPRTRTLSRARAYGPTRSPPPPRVSRTRAPVPRACTSAWVTRVAQARGPANRRLRPYPRIRSALCSRLRTSRNTRVSAAATAMAHSCPHAKPSPQLPEPGQSGSTRGKRLPGGGSVVAGGIRRSASECYSAAFRAENALPRRPTLERTFL